MDRSEICMQPGTEDFGRRQQIFVKMSPLLIWTFLQEREENTEFFSLTIANTTEQIKMVIRAWIGRAKSNIRC